MEIHISQLARPMVCAGYVFMDLPEQEFSEPAEEGTAAAEYLEHLLLNKPLPAQAANGVYFDDDMAFYGKRTAQRILSDAESDLVAEDHVGWQTRSGIKLPGRLDARFIKRTTLYIDDYKYGWGIIEAQKNWQLIGYAIGTIIKLGRVFPEIVMRIHQPRPHHEDGEVREWKITYNELLEYKEQIEVRMEQIAAGYKQLQTSDKCKYCQGAAESCPALNRLFYRSLEVSYDFTQDTLNDAELAQQLDQINRASEVLKLKKDSVEQLAKSRIKLGGIIPGYMTEARYGDRKWKGGVSPKTIKVLTGLNITEEKMLSPAKAEKLGVPAEVVNKLIDRYYMGHKLVCKDAGAYADKIFGEPKT